MTVIEIASIRPPREARKPGHVVDANGASFEAWPEKLAKFEVGRRYAVEVETREWQGRPIRKIVKAQPADPPEISSQVAKKPLSGDAERAFVASVLGAFISAGRVSLDARELERATTMVRSLWRVTFGEGDAHA
jgi:hypothetical protein